MLSGELTLPDRFRVANWLGRKPFIRLLPIFNLEEQSLLSVAAERTQLSDWGDGAFQDAFPRLIESLECDAGLHPVGRVIMRRVLLSYLESRLRLVEESRKHPEVLEKPLRPPLIVMGLPRSGTTLLHRLLAEDPAGRAIPFWILLRPFSETGIQTGMEDDRKAVLDRRMELQRVMSPQLDAKHHIRADSPEECMWMMGLTFVSMVFWVFAPVYGYLEWYLRQDRMEKYRDYRKLLQFLQLHDSKRLTLKAPAHTGGLAELVRNVPEARIVQTHRDPVTCLASLNSLLYSNYHSVTDRLDVARMAEGNLQLLAAESRKNLEARESVPEDGIVDVLYRDLVKDPIAVVRRVYERLDLEWSEALETRMAQYLAQNPKGRFGSHRYDPSDFGQDPARVASIFRDYCERFDVGQT